MNHLKLYTFCVSLFLFTNNNCHVDLPDTIFALSPLTMKIDESTWLKNCMTNAKYTAIPLTVCFYYLISDNNFTTDVTEYPYITAALLYTACHCGYYLAENYRKKIIKIEKEKILQQIFYLMIVGFGLHNSIKNKPRIEMKSIDSVDNQTEDLELFLQNIYDVWMQLFMECIKKNNCKSLFSYKTDQIDMLEILQASSYDTDIMNHVVHDYPTILETLKEKFNLYHEKLIKLQQSQ